MKKIYSECNNLNENSDIINERKNPDMFSYDELMKKSVRELNAMLADNTLFPLDDTANAEIIERICDVIIEKEKVLKPIRKLKNVISWREFKRKFITPDPEKAFLSKEVSLKRKSTKSVFVALPSILAAAVIIIFITKIHAKPLETTPEIIEMTTKKVSATSAIETFYSDYQWSVKITDLTDIATVLAKGTITYADGSKKSYTIYSSDERLFFISILTNTSEDLTSPSENELDPFDIFTDSKIDDTSLKNGDELLKTFTDKGLKIIIYGDISEEKLLNIDISNGTGVLG